VALFQARWALQCHTTNLAEALANAGYRVDVFLYDVDASLVNVRAVARPQLTIHQWAGPGAPNTDGGQGVSAWAEIKKTVKKVPCVSDLSRRVKHKTREMRERWLLRLRSPRGLIPRDVLEKTIASVESAPHVALVGVEKLGLLWAAEVSKATGVPFAYYSLELYTRDHPNANVSAQAKRVKGLEQWAHRAAAVTIVQDERRARVLLADNGVENTRLVFLPVSVPGPPRPSRTQFLHDQLSLQSGAKVILQLGGIRKERLGVQLAASAQSFPPACVLVMHGEGSPSMLQAVKEADHDDRVVLSTHLVSDERLPELIASADVGLVFYGATNQNDILTARSSEKLALFLRSGVPIVAYAYPGYEVIREYRCGVLIHELPQLPDALLTILASREEFSENALRCFVDLYDFNSLVKPVVHTLGHLRYAGV